MGYLQGPLGFDLLPGPGPRLHPHLAECLRDPASPWGSGQLGCYFHLHAGQRRMRVGFQHLRAGGRSPG